MDDTGLYYSWVGMGVGSVFRAYSLICSQGLLLAELEVWNQTRINYVQGEHLYNICSQVILFLSCLYAFSIRVYF